jgi:ppGpp synthetase/RelA/SpoT-type nucleotidyltranferase
LVATVVAKLEQKLAVADFDATVKGRTKEPTSFATKAILKGYARPLEQIRDKAGVRITVVYERDIGSAEAIVRNALHVIHTESKRDALAYNEFGYLGVHCDATLRPEDVVAADTELNDLRVEVQIRTIVQSAWAEVSHEQLYKPPADVPDGLKRQIHRLVALVELFDSEVERFRVSAAATPGYQEAEALVPLSGALLQRFGLTHAPDRRLSLLMAAALVPLYDGLAPVEIYPRVLRTWIEANEEALRIQFEEARVLPTNPLFIQPEVLMIFERLTNEEARLRKAWPDVIPPVWLDELADAWGSGRS